jgi:hypothetical protein
LAVGDVVLHSLHISRQNPSYPDGAAYLATDIDGSCFNTGATLVVVTSMRECSAMTIVYISPVGVVLMERQHG